MTAPQEMIHDAPSNVEGENYQPPQGDEKEQNEQSTFESIIGSGDADQMRKLLFDRTQNLNDEQKKVLFDKINSLSNEEQRQMDTESEMLKANAKERENQERLKAEENGSKFYKDTISEITSKIDGIDTTSSIKKESILEHTIVDDEAFVQSVEQGLGYIDSETTSSFRGNLQTNDKELSTVNKLLAIENANQLMKASTIDKQLLDSTIAALKLYADDPAVKPLLDNLENRRDTLTLEEMEKFDYSNVQDLEASIDADIVALRVLRKSFENRNNTSYNDRIQSLIQDLETKRATFLKNKTTENQANF